MNKVGKVFLIGCGGVVLLGVAAVVAIGLYMRSHGGEMLAVREQGVADGRKLVGTACVDEALGRPAAGFGDALDSRLWLDGCLEGSNPGEAVCAGVPPQTEIMKSVQWRMEQCQAHGHANDNGCTNLLASVQQYCERRVPAPGG
jgi:hypothetical protein